MGRGGEELKENVGIKPGYWDCILYQGQINQESDQRIFIVSLHKFCLKLQLYNLCIDERVDNVYWHTNDVSKDSDNAKQLLC